MNADKKLIAVSIVAGAALLAGCSNDSDEDGPDLSNTPALSSDSATAQGRITGFGSIFVSGVKYETDNAAITVDGQPASEDDLQLGQVVTVRGVSSGDIGNAISVSYDDIVDGIVTNVSLDQKGLGSIAVMGYEVTVDANTIVEFYTSNITALSQAVYDQNVGIQYIAEVSGYSDGNNRIHATRIDVKDYDPVNGYIEIKGYVNNFDANSATFAIANMEVAYNTATLFDDMTESMLADGMLVEVKGNGFDSQGRLLADRIENEINSGASSGTVDDDYEIEGVVSSVSSDQFVLNGYTIFYDQNTLGTEYLTEGALVEVDAYRDDQSRLIAEEIEPDELDDNYHTKLEMKSLVQDVDLVNNTVQVMGKTIQLTSSTMMWDEYTKQRYFGLDDINWSSGSHYIEVKAYLDNGGNLTASRLIYEGIGSGETEELEGVLSIDETGPNVMGIAVDFGAQPTPANGMRVEMEGVYSSGMFYATSLEAEPIDSASSDANSNS
jgi:hypothetical protein